MLTNKLLPSSIAQHILFDLLFFDAGNLAVAKINCMLIELIFIYNVEI